MMRSMPIDVFSVKDAEIREDNKLVRPMYLTRVKAPSASSIQATSMKSSAR